MDILYQVIIENQKIRTDLLKWKLILCTALASIGLCSTSVTVSQTLPHIDVVLCCIPFVAAYVDLMCSHMSLRVQVIGKFVRLTQFKNEPGKSLHAYEQFVGLTRGEKKGKLSAFALESWAMYASSLILSGLVFVYGTFAAFEDGQRTRNTIVHASWFWSAGVIGAALTLGILLSYKLRYKAIDSIKHRVLEQLAEDDDARA